MPWNEPGGNDNNKSQSGPPDLDKLLKEFVNKIPTLFVRKKPSSKKDHHYSIGLMVIVLLLLWVFTGFFIVNPAEEAVVLRFGKYADVLHPGLHWIARFIDTKYLVNVQKIASFSVQGDFLTKSADQGDIPNQVIAVDMMKKTSTESDQSKNLVNVELSVQYRVSDPRAYLFNVVSPDDTIHQVAAGVLSDVIGKMKLDDVLTTGRELLSSSVLEQTRQIMQSYNPGLEVVAVTLRKVQAPDQVQIAFNDVNRADQDRSTTIQQAQAYASKVVPIAQGVAARILADANAYQQQVVLTAQANVAKYQALSSVYSKSPDITRERMYLETMQAIFSHTTKILVDFNTSNNMLYLPLDKLMRQAEEITDDAKPPVTQLMSAHSEMGVKNDAQ